MEHRRFTAKNEYLCEIAKETQKFRADWVRKHRVFYRIADITIQVDSDLPISETTFDPKFKQFKVSGKGKDTVTIMNTVTKFADGTYGLKWNYDTLFDANNGRHIKGVSKFKLLEDSVIGLNTTLEKDIIQLKLVTGLKEVNDNVEIFIKHHEISAFTAR